MTAAILSTVDQLASDANDSQVYAGVASALESLIAFVATRPAIESNDWRLMDLGTLVEVLQSDLRDAKASIARLALPVGERE